MSRPVSITKEMIDEAAFALVRADGIDAMTVRNIARALNCSTKPIYTTYGCMEELRKAVQQKIGLCMKEHLYGYRKTGQPLIDLGIAYVLFAAKEKHLFLYMCQTISYSKVNFALIANEGVRKMYAEQIGENLEKPGKTWKNLEKLANNCGLFVFGLSMSCCYRVFRPTEEELQTLLEDFLSIQLKGI